MVLNNILIIDDYMKDIVKIKKGGYFNCLPVSMASLFHASPENQQYFSRYPNEKQ
jgi:hypothetical protein